MAEDMIELGLEGFDKLVDRYHDRAYNTATDASGSMWKRMHLPGQRKSVYVEQNPQNGQKAQLFDPSKDRVPAGWKVDRPEDNRGRNDTMTQDDYDSERGRSPRYDRREPSMVNERDFSGYDNLDSPRKPYPNEMPRDPYGGYPPPPPPQQQFSPPPQPYFPPPPRAPLEDYGPRQNNPYRPDAYQPDPYLAPAAAAGGAMLAQDQIYPREDRQYPRSDTENRLDRQRSVPQYARSYSSDSDSSPPPRRRTRSAAPKDDRRKSKDKAKPKKDFSIASSVAGAVAGGLLGRHLGKGDFITTAAGAAVGALGADIVAGPKNKDKREKDKRDSDSRRSSRQERKDWDYTYKDRY